MPSAFFSCQQLRRLNLRFCLINPPRIFNGFGQLIKLKLLKVDIADKVLGSLISSCPLLEEMQLEMLSILNHLEIVAPKLRLFCVGSAIKAILFRNTPALTMVSLAICGPSVAAIFDQVGRDIIDHFGFLSNLENLHLDYYFLKSLVAGGVPKRLATALIYLEHLKLSYVSLDVLSEVSFIICLLRSSPNVQRIEISFFHEQRVDASLAYEFLVAQDPSDLNLNQLVKVKLEYVNETENEMHFIKALLENVPKLETLEIDSIGELNGDSEKAFLKELMKFPRSSPNARIVYRG